MKVEDLPVDASEFVRTPLVPPTYPATILLVVFPTTLRIIVEVSRMLPNHIYCHECYEMQVLSSRRNVGLRIGSAWCGSSGSITEFFFFLIRRDHVMRMDSLVTIPQKYLAIQFDAAGKFISHFKGDSIGRFLNHSGVLLK